MNVWTTRMAVLGLMAGLLPVAGLAQVGMDPTGPGANPMGQGNSNMPGQPLSGPTNPNGVQPTPMRESLGAPGLTGRQMHDQQFLREAAEGGIAEVQMGKLATEKGGSDVKEFGQKMVEDHTALNAEMAKVADQMGVLLPKKMGKQDQEEYDKLSGLSGDDFDKEYIAYMMTDHRKDLHEFRMEATTATDENLQTEVTKAAGAIRQHLQMAIKLAQEKGVPLPPRPPRRPAPAGE